jgi:hypothetical protein
MKKAPRPASAAEIRRKQTLIAKQSSGQIMSRNHDSKA